MGNKYDQYIIHMFRILVVYVNFLFKFENYTKSAAVVPRYFLCSKCTNKVQLYQLSHPQCRVP